MRVKESRIRQIIREEARRIIRESEGVGLKIDEFVWDDIHNDGGSRSQGGELTLKFSAGDMSNMEAMKYIGSYSMGETSLLEDLTDVINDTLTQNELPTVSMDELKGALGSKLGDIMSELERSEATYQRDAEEADRYSSGGGDFYESRRRRGALVESRVIRQIIREEARRIIRENDEGPSDLEGEGDHASWGDVYEILEIRMNHETGRNGIWVKTGYRPGPGVPKDPTHMMEGNYTDLFSFVVKYLSDFNNESHGPFGRYYGGPKPTSLDKVVRAREPDRDKRFDKIIRFMKEFESNFPGAADQNKINDRLLGGPGPNRTRVNSPMVIPIPYFDDFKKVILTWLTNTLTGEDRPIPWPEDEELT